MIRNTVQRTMILEAVRSMTNHPTAEQVYTEVAARCAGISRATVYRVLGHLADEGEIQRVAIANAPDRFDLTLTRHAHCICESCGRVFDLPLDRFPEVGAGTDFRIRELRVNGSGICAECTKKS